MAGEAMVGSARASPAPRGSRVEPRGARAGQNRAPRAAQAVPGGEALSTKMGDAHAAAEHAPEGLVDPTVAWGALGAHVVTARGARRACGGGGVSVRNLIGIYPVEASADWERRSGCAHARPLRRAHTCSRPARSPRSSRGAALC
jgi:hypothetical protein